MELLAVEEDRDPDLAVLGRCPCWVDVHCGFRNEQRCPSRPADEPLDFSHTAGAPCAEDDRLLVRLEPGDWVSYDVHVTDASHLEIAVHADAPVQVRFDDIDLAAGAVTRSDSLISPGRHEVRLSATQQRSSTDWRLRRSAHPSAKPAGRR